MSKEKQKKSKAETKYDKALSVVKEFKMKGKKQKAAQELAGQLLEEVYHGNCSMPVDITVYDTGIEMEWNQKGGNKLVAGLSFKGKLRVDMNADSKALAEFTTIANIVYSLV